MYGEITYNVSKSINMEWIPYFDSIVRFSKSDSLVQ